MKSLEGGEAKCNSWNDELKERNKAAGLRGLSTGFIFGVNAEEVSLSLHDEAGR